MISTALLKKGTFHTDSLISTRETFIFLLSIKTMSICLYRRLFLCVLMNCFLVTFCKFDDSSSPVCIFYPFGDLDFTFTFYWFLFYSVLFCFFKPFVLHVWHLITVCACVVCSCISSLALVLKPGLIPRHCVVSQFSSWLKPWTDSAIVCHFAADSWWIGLFGMVITHLNLRQIEFGTCILQVKFVLQHQFSSLSVFTLLQAGFRCLIITWLVLWTWVPPTLQQSLPPWRHECNPVKKKRIKCV